MGTPVSAATTLRTQGLQFVRVFQGALRLTMLYSADQEQVQALVERALTPLDAVLKETPMLSVAFQFDRVLLNSVPVADPPLAPLAGELTKRRVGFLAFSEGIDQAGLARVLTILATKPETIEERGGPVRFLRANPLQHARIVPIEMAAEDGSLAVVTSAEEAAAMARIPRWLTRALQDMEGAGETELIAQRELLALADSLAPELTPEQRLLLPQLQQLLVRVVQRANTSALSELVRSAAVEVGGAGEELLQSVLLQGLTAAAERGEVPQAERILRVVSELKVEPESLLQMLLGKSAAEALSEKISGPQWYVVRNAVTAMAELADPALLDRLEPALSHSDERVQQAAVTAVLKTRSPARGLSLARALPALKPAVLETVLDDLLVLKEPQVVPHLEQFLRQRGDDRRAHLLQKAVAALWSIGTEDAARALLNCANEATLERPLRVAALRALARLELPFAQQALQEFVSDTSEAMLAEEARKLLGARQPRPLLHLRWFPSSFPP